MEESTLDTKAFIERYCEKGSERQVMAILIGFIWLRIGTSGGFW
jgi:hypothetical protein